MIWLDFNDQFSSNRQTRGEQIYIKVRIFLKDRALTLPFWRLASIQTNIVERHAHSRRLYWVVRAAAGMENKKMTHQRS